MTSTYKLPMQLYEDFKNTCRIHGLPPAKVIRRLIALYTQKPESFTKISSMEFLQNVVKTYGYEAL